MCWWLQQIYQIWNVSRKSNFAIGTVCGLQINYISKHIQEENLSNVRNVLRLLFKHLIWKIISEYIQERNLSDVCNVSRLLLNPVLSKPISKHIQEENPSNVCNVQSLIEKKLISKVILKLIHKRRLFPQYQPTSSQKDNWTATHSWFILGLIQINKTDFIIIS
jgi:hypothetical protein